MGFVIANAISMVKTFIAGVNRSTMLALDGLVAFIFDSVEGVSDTYVGDAKGDDRTSGRAIQPGRCYEFDATDDYIGLTSQIDLTGAYSIEWQGRIDTTTQAHIVAFSGNSRIWYGGSNLNIRYSSTTTRNIAHTWDTGNMHLYRVERDGSGNTSFYVDDVLIGTDSSGDTGTLTIDLIANTYYPLYIQQAEIAGDNQRLIVQWESTSQTKEIIPKDKLATHNHQDSWFINNFDCLYTYFRVSQYYLLLLVARVKFIEL